MLRALRLALVVVVTLTIQTTWMADWRPFGVPGDLLLLVSIAAGLAGGSHRGAIVGFAVGMSIDATMLTPFGLSALTYLAVGYCVGSVNEGVLRDAPWIPPVATLVATVVGMLFYVLLGQLVGQQFRQTDLVKAIGVSAGVNTLLCVPMLWTMRWVERAASVNVPRVAR